MFRHLFARRQTQAPRDTARRIDRRSGNPVRHHPEPMPRMRWYS